MSANSRGPSHTKEQTVGDVARRLHPIDELQDFDWPADLFAVAALILRESGAYVQIVNAWPPNAYSDVDAWHAKAAQARLAWRNTYNTGASGLPPDVGVWWDRIIDSAAVPLGQVANSPELVEALVGVVAAADEACHGVGVLTSANDEFDDYALSLLSARGTLCEIVAASRAVVLPKLHNPKTGLTLRSLTHNLAFWDRLEVRPLWNQLDLPPLGSSANLLILPWPLAMSPSSIHEVASSAGLPQNCGHFTYDGGSPIDKRRLSAIVSRAESMVGRVHAVIFPELSLTEADLSVVESVIGDRLVIAGVGQPATPTRFGFNRVIVSVPATLGGRYQQGKHHRWRLDRRQLDGYGLAYCFGDDRNSWWEAIRIEPRQCGFFTVNEWLTFCPLICEDLARQDPVAELVRCVGPNLVVALLMDGPQIADRWSARYATVLAEDPRSSVLTVTSAALVDLSRAQFGGGPRSIGLWKDAESTSARQILLEPGAEAVVLSVRHDRKKEWTADGRHDNETTEYLLLSGIYQVFPEATP